MIVALFAFMVLEFIQWYKTGSKNYFTDPWNWIYLSLYTMNGIVIYQHEIRMEDQYWIDMNLSLASMVALLLWICLFYWLRLFEAFARDVYLITETMRDVVQFLIIFAIIMLAFGSGLFILDKNTVEYEFDWVASPEIPNT